MHGQRGEFMTGPVAYCGVLEQAVSGSASEALLRETHPDELTAAQATE